jgi:putative transposase
LKDLVHASFAASKGRYGSPRIHRDLLEQPHCVSRKRVIRLMREEKLKARVRKRFRCTTMSDHDQPVAANLLDRPFTAVAPNRRWVGDTTEFVIGESGIWPPSWICSRGSSSGGRSAPSTTDT